MINLIESYFDGLGDIGRAILVTDRAGRPLETGEAMGRVVETSLWARQRKARVFFIGNGGSAGITSHMAIDWMKNGGFTTMAFNDGASLTCLANDLGYDQVFALPLSRHAKEGDLLFAISSSGRSGNILSGVQAAGKAGAFIVTLSGFSADNPLRREGDINFYVPNRLYGFVEIAHLTICHAILDIGMGWRVEEATPAYMGADAI